MKNIVVTTLIILSTTYSFSQTAREVLIKHYNAGNEFYEVKDYQQFLYHFKKADSISPEHPTIVYNVAAGYALNNQIDNCIKYLKKAVLMNTKLFPIKDTDFNSIRQSAEFKEIEYLKEELEKEVKLSVSAFVNDESDLHPESITYDPNTETFLISSVHKNKIISYNPKTNEHKDWKSSKTDSLWAVMGMKVDAVNNELWVCTTATKEMLDFDSTLEGKTAVHRYDLVSKKLIKRYELSGGHWFGDLVIHPSGDVYVSDSQTPIIYKIDREKNKLSVFKDFTGTLYNLQGIDFDPTGEVMFIADYKTGIYRFELNTKDLSFIPNPESMITKGIDGLYFHRGNLIGIHNGVRPMRVCRYKLDQSFTSIIDYEYIDKAREELDEPTLGVIVNNEFYYIANSPWGYYNKDGNLDTEKLKSNIVLKYSLNEN